jgi:hypothetical protein
MAVLGGRAARKKRWAMNPSTTSCRPLLRVEMLEDRTAPATFPVTTIPGFVEMARVLEPAVVVMADFNQDGIQDQATAHKDSRDISVSLGRHNGTFQVELRFLVGGSGPGGLLVGDFNGNGRLDLISVALDGNEVYYLSGNGDGTFLKAVLVGTEELREAESIVLLRMDVAELFTLEDTGPNQVPNHRVDDVNQPDRTETLPLDRVMQSAAGGSLSMEERLCPDTLEGDQWAEVLASAGSAPSLPRPEGSRMRLPDVFVLVGPGFGTDLGILSEGVEQYDAPRDPGLHNQASPVGPAPQLRVDGAQSGGAAQADEEESFGDPPSIESLRGHSQHPWNDPFGPNRLDDVHAGSELAEIMAAVATLGVLANETAMGLSRGRKKRARQPEGGSLRWHQGIPR